MNKVSAALDLWRRRLLLRSALTEQAQAAILALPTIEHVYQSERDVVRLGELTTESCLVVEGIVGKFHQDGEGLRQVSAVFIPGDMADLHSVPLPQASAALSALGSIRVARIPHEAIRDLTQRHLDFAEACWRDTTVDAQIASEWVFTLGRFSAAARLAHFMCELGLRFEKVGGQRLQYPLPLTQRHLGEILGLTSVHVNRTARELREGGWAELTSRRVTISDWDGLARVGQFDPRYLHLSREPRV